MHVTRMHAALLDGLGIKVKLQNLTLLQEVLEPNLRCKSMLRTERCPNNFRSCTAPAACQARAEVLEDLSSELNR